MSSSDKITNIAYLKWIENNPQKFADIMAKRQSDIKSDVVIDFYSRWKHVKQKLDTANHELNIASSEIAKNKTNFAKVAEIKENIIELKNDIYELEYIEKTAKHELALYANLMPNLLDDSVPFGASDAENVVVETYGDNSKVGLHHEDIAAQMGCWGREAAVNMSGSRFIILGGELAKLERVLCQFALDYLIKHDFYELAVPYLVSREAMFNSGQLPKFEENFFSTDSNHCLIPTGEVPLVNYFANQVLTAPHRVVACTPCFRKEAGSLGKDTKGMIRVHQFSKVEMVCVTSQEKSQEMHMQMLGHSKKLLQMLNLPYRVVKICSGDISFTAIDQYDIEVWMPGQGKYVEVASCSNCADFQAQRMNLKYVVDTTKHFAHTLNGTALSGRVLAAILEHFYIDGKLQIPSVLQYYYGQE